MALLKMVIADDEAIIRNGLKTIVDWREIGIEIVGEAADGQEALDLCGQFAPDILFTDIRMPLVDGLEVATRLLERGSPTRVVLISGAQDFSYAKTALSINAEGYVLKPVNIPELEYLMTRVATRISVERNKRQELDSLREQVHTSRPVMLEKFLADMVFRQRRDTADVDAQLEYFELPFRRDDAFIVAVFKMDDYRHIAQSTTPDDLWVLRLSVHNIAAEIMRSSRAGVCLSVNEDELVAIFSPEGHRQHRHADTCEEIASCLHTCLNMTVSVGIGALVDGVGELNKSYRDALAVLQNRFYLGGAVVMDIRDFQVPAAGSTLSLPHLRTMEDELLNFVKLGNTEGMMRVLMDIFASLTGGANLPVGQVKTVLMEMVCMASTSLQELGESLDDLFDAVSSVIDTIVSTDSASELKNYLFRVFSTITDHFAEKITRRNARTITSIKQIIECNYYLDLSVASISQQVFLTPNYISRIFKQETGETITEYILRLRMDQAKVIIATSDFNIRETAMAVGYDDANYFSKVFKKYTGLSPREYKAISS